MLSVLIGASSGYVNVCVIWKLREMDIANLKWIGIWAYVGFMLGSVAILLTVFVAKIFNTTEPCTE